MPTDLVLLVPDKNIELGLRGLLNRPQALGIRAINFKIYVHPQRDPGCAVKSHEFLRPFSTDYEHALVIFDRQGSGRETVTATELSDSVRERLSANGWGERSEAIVIEPEIEAWVFSPSPHVEQCVGWNEATSLRDWLQQRGFWGATTKPPDPKAALEAALRHVRRPRSSSIYECLARSVSLVGCQDQQFQRLCQILQDWFPAS
jgi:hypothetical protein